MKAAAIMCVRNEAHYIEYCLQYLIAEGLEIVLVDHDSDDDTVRLAKKHLNTGLLAIETMPWKGYFSLVDQLRKKQEIIAALDHHWILHVDADEWLTSPIEGESLCEALQAVDARGFNCVNFNEFVFVPWPDEKFEGTDYRKHMLTYYFIDHAKPRLMRAWRKDAALENVESGGHVLRGTLIRPFPSDFILRHYICLSHEHACAKYLSRRFAQSELDRGWHKKRIGLNSEKLQLRNSPLLRGLPHWDSKGFDISTPTNSHFWEW